MSEIKSATAGARTQLGIYNPSIPEHEARYTQHICPRCLKANGENESGVIVQCPECQTEYRVPPKALFPFTPTAQVVPNLLTDGSLAYDVQVTDGHSVIEINCISERLAVDANLVNGQLVLTTEDGITVTNVIVLEPEVLDALNKFMARMKAGGQ